LNTFNKSKTSAKELNRKIEQHLEELAQATDKARTSKEMFRYLDFCAKFHHYSAGNIWLILLAEPNASYVAGFQKWKSMGRWVLKGEHGIPILAPVLVKDEDDDGLEMKSLVGFKTVYVFDVSQTDGEDLPEVPDWKSPEKNEELNQKLIHFAKAQDISVTFQVLDGDAQGVSKGGEVVIDPSAGSKTLIHEIAHELMHKDDNIHQHRAIKELEAESVAYVVSKHFGLGGLNSPNYLVLHDVSASEMVAHMDRVRQIVNKIVSHIEEQLICDTNN